jgi:hypothetical protein
VPSRYDADGAAAAFAADLIAKGRRNCADFVLGKSGKSPNDRGVAERERPRRACDGKIATRSKWIRNDS